MTMEFRAKRRTLKVFVDDDTFEVKFPTQGQLTEYRKSLESEPGKAETLLENFLAQFGLPVEAYKRLELPDAKQLIELLTDQKKV